MTPDRDAGERFEPSRLVLVRHRRGLSVSALGGVSGIRYPRIYGMEHGKLLPSAAEVGALATALSWPIEFFYGAPVERVEEWMCS